MASAPPTPAGPYTVPLHRLAQMLSECAAFQTRCSLTYPDADAEAKLVNGDGGLKRIYYPDLTDENALAGMPYAVITWGGEWRMPQSSGGARNYFSGAQGELILRIADKSRYPANREAALRDFGNFVGQVILTGDDDNPGLLELAALDDRLVISDLAQTEPPWECERREGEANGEIYWQAEFSVRYGFSGGG